MYFFESEPESTIVMQDGFEQQTFFDVGRPELRKSNKTRFARNLRFSSRKDLPHTKSTELLYHFSRIKSTKMNEYEKFFEIEMTLFNKI